MGISCGAVRLPLETDSRRVYNSPLVFPVSGDLAKTSDGIRPVFLMILTISLSEESEERLRKKAAELGQPLDVYAARVLEEAAKTASAPADDQGTINLLQSWNAEDATNDPAELSARQREWEEFASSINAHHPSNRKIYP